MTFRFNRAWGFPKRPKQEQERPKHKNHWWMDMKGQGWASAGGSQPQFSVELSGVSLIAQSSQNLNDKIS